MKSRRRRSRRRGGQRPPLGLRADARSRAHGHTAARQRHLSGRSETERGPELTENTMVTQTTRICQRIWSQRSLSTSVSRLWPVTGSTRGLAPPWTPEPTRNLARLRTCGSPGRPRQNPRGTEAVVAVSWGTGVAFSARSHPPGAHPRDAHSVHIASRGPRKRWEAPGTSAQVTKPFVALSTGR